jgi:hypothetical protein
MDAAVRAELISELDAAVARGFERRNVILLRITHLFLSTADRLNEVQVGIFDDVLLRLISRAEPQSLVKLSSTLSEFTPAPGKVLNGLACHEDISIASPVLVRSHFLLLSSTGLAYRRCSLVWIDGSQVGVHFIPRDSKKKAKPSDGKG